MSPLDDDHRLPSGWQGIGFADTAETVSNDGKKVKQRDYLVSGRFAVIDQGQEFIGGYSDDETLVIDAVSPVVVFGDHTRVFKYVDFPFVCGADGVKVVKPSLAWNPRLFYYFLQAIDLPDRGYSRHFQFLKKILLRLPPRNEQARIVEAIEEQFTRLDSGVATLKRVEANLKRYKASVLKAACEGKLTEKWRQDNPDVEPASELLKRILKERRRKWEEAQLAKMTAKGKPPKNDKWKDKYKEPMDPLIDELPELPDYWTWATVEQVSLLVTDGDHNPPKRVPEGVPHLTAKHVKNWQLVFEKCTFISATDFEITSQRYEPAENDLIVTCVGTLGETALVPSSCLFSADRNLAAIRMTDVGMQPYLLLLILNAPSWQRRMSKASGSTAQPHLYLGDIRSLPIPLMPLAEQEQIIESTDMLLSQVESATTVVTGVGRRADRLRQSILKRAFEGKLVEQNPDDEPASVLLARIKAERKNQQTTTAPKSNRGKGSSRRLA